MRRIAQGLNRDGVRSPAGRDVWSVSTIGRTLPNEAYVGRAYDNRTEAVAAARAHGKNPADGAVAGPVDRHPRSSGPRGGTIRSGTACSATTRGGVPGARNSDTRCCAGWSRTLAVARAGQVRTLPRGGVVPQDARPQLSRGLHRPRRVAAPGQGTSGTKESPAREQLAQHNALRKRIAGFSSAMRATFDLDFEQRQKMLRLVVDQVLVSG